MADDQFLTPEIPIRRPPWRDGPRVLLTGASAGRWIERVTTELETFVDLRHASDAARARWEVEGHPAWLAHVVDVGHGEEAELLGLAEWLHAHDETVPMLLVVGVPVPKLHVRTASMGAWVAEAAHAETEEVVVAFLQRAVKLRANVSDRLVRALMDAYTLTVQEARIVRLALAGETRAAIAEMLDISPKTYDRHSENIRDKTGRSLASLREHPGDELLAELVAKRDKALGGV